MNREPLGLYLFRYILGLGLFAFMAMLYWSSVLLEENVKRVHEEIEQLKNDLYGLRAGIGQVHRDVLQAVLEDQKFQQEMLLKAVRQPLRDLDPEAVAPRRHPEEKGHPEIVRESPNLLEKDPFYAQVLPTLLPKDFVPKGERHEYTVGKPDNLHPFANWSSVSSWNDMCVATAAQNQFGKFETFAPSMAVKIELRPDPETGKEEFWVHLRDHVFWQPLDPDHFPEDVKLDGHFLRKQPVTAHDFKFFYDAVMNPQNQLAGAVSLRNYLGDIEQIRVIDDLTFVVRWRTHPLPSPIEGKEEGMKYTAKQWTGSLRPLPRFVYQYFPDGKKIVEDDSDPDTYRTHSIWAQNFAQHWAKNVIVSCGPWIFDGMTDRAIRFRRNPDHFEPLAVLVQELNTAIKDTPEAVWQDFKGGKLDLYSVQPSQLVELEEFLASDEYARQKQEGKGIQHLDYMSRSYSYIGWNQARPFFSNPKLRRAMTMAIDRRRIIDTVLNGMGATITGPFYRYSPSYNQQVSAWPYDPTEAQRLLEQEGWYDADGDGIREKLVEGASVPFRFSLTYYVKNPTSKIIAEYVSTALKEIGVDCQLHGVDIADLSSAFDDKNFDAIYLGWALGAPPEDPSQLWHSRGAKEKGSSNAVGFVNQEADEIIDRLQFEYNEEERLKLYHRFHEIIHEEAPYTFLYTPKTRLLYRDHLQNVFLPVDRQDLIPGANMAQPDSSIFWLKE